jgi:RNA polymerase sigma-70 factor (ECF subfamily)
LAPSWEATDWRRIVELYDATLDRTRSPVVALNRAVAVGELLGPEAALVALEALGGELSMRRYGPYEAARGEMLRRLGRLPEARVHFQRSAERAASEPVRRFLERRIRECTSDPPRAVENEDARPSRG